MIVSGNSINEYNDMLELSIEDFLIRFKLYIDSQIK